jgi:1,4-dihydroxy-2-naphthoyl-CoA hydrolase
MAFAYERNVHFADTDAAGVVYFARYLSLCHEAYEECLAASGIALQPFFQQAGLLLPIRSSNADYLRPLRGGDRVRVHVTVRAQGEDAFATEYALERLEGPRARLAARVTLQHVCIRADARDRAPLPPELRAWIAAHPPPA